MSGKRLSQFIVRFTLDQLVHVNFVFWKAAWANFRWIKRIWSNPIFLANRKDLKILIPTPLFIFTGNFQRTPESSTRMDQICPTYPSVYLEKTKPGGKISILRGILPESASHRNWCSYKETSGMLYKSERKQDHLKSTNWKSTCPLSFLISKIHFSFIGSLLPFPATTFENCKPRREFLSSNMSRYPIIWNFFDHKYIQK